MPGAPISSPVDYRLAPEDPFPAAVEDALSVYHYLLERGYSPAQLVPVGYISAGGDARPHDAPCRAKTGVADAGSG